MVLKNYLSFTHNARLKKVQINKFLAMYLFTLDYSIFSFQVHCVFPSLLWVRGDHSRFFIMYKAPYVRSVLETLKLLHDDKF